MQNNNSTRADPLFEKVPFEERIRRLRSGCASSPQYTLEVLRRYSALRVASVIGMTDSGIYGTSLAPLLRAVYGKNMAELTFGGLAALAVEEYRKPQAERAAPIERLIQPYLDCFSLAEEFDADSRALAGGPMKTVWEYGQIGLGEYVRCLARTDVPARTKAYLYGHQLMLGYSERMPLLQIYRYLKWALTRDDAADGGRQNGKEQESAEGYTDEELRPFFEYFIVPVAAFAGKERRSAQDKEQNKTGKEQEHERK